MEGIVSRGTPREIDAPTPRLTRRQIECLEWVHRGYETKEIARELGISPDTVDMHIKNASQRLGVSSRRMAARMIHGAAGLPQALVPLSSGMSPQHVSDDAGATAAPIAVEASSLVERVGWPLPTMEAPSNRLTRAQRLFWVLAIAVGVMFGFGALLSSLEALGRLLKR